MAPSADDIPPTLIKLVPELGASNVRMKDPVAVEAAIKAMARDAHHKLQVIADFDRTLSKYIEDGKLCSTTHGVMEESKLMPSFYKEESKKLKDKYLPIEFDSSIPVQEKIPKMIEWWTQGHALIASCKLTRNMMHEIVSESNARLRDGCRWFFEQCTQHEVPVLIFSAGIGDVILETISQQAAFHPANMKIVSNMFSFDEEGTMNGFQDSEIIHTFNKNENAIHSSDYFPKIQHRHHLLLLGDSLGDLRMAQGAEDVEVNLKVGFLNFKVEENLPIYMESFDIVIIEDETMNVVNGIMRTVLDLPKEQS